MHVSSFCLVSLGLCISRWNHPCSQGDELAQPRGRLGELVTCKLGLVFCCGVLNLQWFLNKRRHFLLFLYKLHGQSCHYLKSYLMTFYDCGKTLHNIKFTILTIFKCAVQRHSHSCAIIPIIHPQNFFIFPNWNSVPVKQLTSPRPLQPLAFTLPLSLWIWL